MPGETDILVIDDLRTFLGFEAVYARTSAEGIAMLEARTWREVWFDHDLGLLESGATDDIRPVLTWIEQQHYTGKAVPFEVAVVHTANTSAAETLVRALKLIVPTRRVNVLEIPHTT